MSAVRPAPELVEAVTGNRAAYERHRDARAAKVEPVRELEQKKERDHDLCHDRPDPELSAKGHGGSRPFAGPWKGSKKC